VHLVAHGDSLSYRNEAGDLVTGTVTQIDEAFADSGVATASLVLDDATQALSILSFDETALLDRSVVLARGNQAPGLAAGTTIEELSGGARIGGTSENRTYGFLAFLSGSEFPGFSESAVFIADSEFVPLVVVQAGAPVPDMPQMILDSPRVPVLGLRGAAVRYTAVDDESERAAIGFVDFQTQMFRTLVKAGDPVPGGVLTNLPLSFAINTEDDLVFRGDFGGGQSAYFALSTVTVGAAPRRLIGTGDFVALPQGGQGLITSLGMIPATGGLGGEATAVGPTHMTVSATLDGETGAILLVEIPD
jgi:hypothetical protein